MHDHNVKPAQFYGFYWEAHPYAEMFTSWGANFPMYDRRDRPQSQRPHTSRKEDPPTQHTMNGTFTPNGTDQDRWGNTYRSYSARQDYGGPMPDYFAANAASPHSPRFTGHYDHHRSHRERGPPVSFEQASTALYEALEAASSGCQKLETSFQSYTRGLSVWLPAHHMDPLWTKYMDWDGRPVQRVADTDEAPPKADPDVPTYCDIQRRLGRALSAAFTCAETPAKLGPGIDGASGYATPSWQILRSTTRKLRISLEAIEELLGMVRVRRDCMPSLVHEILAAMQLLESIRPLWDIPAKSTSTPSKEDPYDSRRSREL